jgi:cytochrome c oxidase subunit 2
VYLAAMSFQWTPILRLERGAEYTLHLSSLDMVHGFGLYPINVNFMVVPGYDYGLRVTPNEAGDFRIICNEFCGIGHHTMVGRVIVDEPGVAAAAATSSDGVTNVPVRAPAAGRPGGAP